MSKSFEKCPAGYWTIQEVEDYLGVGYQTFKDELKPTNYDYSSNEPGMPKNLYDEESVLIYDELYRYHENKDRYNVNQVAKLLHRSSSWVLQELKPTDQVIRKKTYIYLL